MISTATHTPLPHLSKGFWLAHLEECLNSDATALRAYLTELRSDSPLRASRFVGRDLVGADPRFGPNTTRELANEWFGAFQANVGPSQRNVLRGPGGFEDQLRALLVGQPTGVFDAARGARYVDDRERVRALARAAVEAGLADPFPALGRWRNFFGDVEQIVRITVRTAIELALGIGPDDPVERSSEIILPIEVFWTRPHPWLEGWVLGRDHRAESGPAEATSGSVTIVFATPPTGTAIAPDPAGGCRHPRTWDSEPAEEWRGLPNAEELDRPLDDSAGPGPRRRPKQAPRAMLRICHADHVALPPLNSRRESACGEWILPEPGGAYVGVGPIRAVHRATITGGVNPYAEPTLRNG